MTRSVSEIVTNPRPSSDRPTMTMRLTSRAEPRSPRRIRLIRLRLPFICLTSIARSRVGRCAGLADQVALLDCLFARRVVDLAGDFVVDADLRQDGGRQRERTIADGTVIL